MGDHDPKKRQAKLRAVIRVNGNVQGVFFRASARTEAQRLGLTGFVENQADGSILITTEGAQEALHDFIVWCRKGPRFALVKSCTVQWRTATGQFAGFAIR